MKSYRPGIMRFRKNHKEVIEKRWFSNSSVWIKDSKAMKSKKEFVVGASTQLSWAEIKK